MTLKLRVAAQGYWLALDGQLLARLRGGDAALLGGAGPWVRDREAAIVASVSDRLQLVLSVAARASALIQPDPAGPALHDPAAAVTTGGVLLPALGDSYCAAR